MFGLIVFCFLIVSIFVVNCLEFCCSLFFRVFELFVVLLCVLCVVVCLLCVLCVLPHLPPDPPPPDNPPPDRPLPDRPPPDCPKFRFFFSLSRPIFALFFSLLVVFWWCLKRHGAQMCTFGLSGCCVKPRPLQINEMCRLPKSLGETQGGMSEYRQAQETGHFHRHAGYEFRSRSHGREAL